MHNSALSSLVILLGIFNVSHAATQVFNSVAETTLNQSSPDNNMGGHTTFLAGVTNRGEFRRGLIRFDVSSLPSNSTITSVSLQLTVPDGNVANTPNFALHRMITAWVEGNKSGNNGAAATAGEATWNTSGIGDWESPGAGIGVDYITSQSADINVNGVGSYNWTSAGLTADVQAWVSGSSANNGWIMIETTGVNQTARRFSATSDPALTVVYSAVPETSSTAMFALGGITLLVRKRKS